MKNVVRVRRLNAVPSVNDQQEMIDFKNSIDIDEAIMYDDEGEQASSESYEIQAGIYREDIVDMNIIRFQQQRRKTGLSSHYFKHDCKMHEDATVAEIATKINDKLGLLVGKYMIHAFNVIEFYNEHIILSVVTTPDQGEMTIEGYGDKTELAVILAGLQKIYPKLSTKKVGKMTWYYATSKGVSHKEISIDSKAKPIKDIYYPFIKGGINNLLENYHNDNNTILLLTGEPGTGKTSFIRHYINSYKLKSIVTYDEAVMQQDEFFINYMTNVKNNLMVVEDADLLISDRLAGENKIMSKFLNVSDGLLKNHQKKIIFSTNITQMSSIDPAIVRPGRCYDVINFRKLTAEEANIVCEEEGLPRFNDNQTKTLAEIFNRTNTNQGPRKGFF